MTAEMRLGPSWCVALGAILFVELLTAQAPPSAYPALPSETPSKFAPVTSSFDYIRRDVMIPLRDGVKLHTVILVPQGAKNAPILLTRTPYNATELTSHSESAHLGPILNSGAKGLSGYDNPLEVIIEGGSIRVVQDVRGKYGSEGDYVMNRSLHRPRNPTPVDHSLGRCHSKPARSNRLVRQRIDLGAMAVDDQREASGRPDVVAFTSEVLSAQVKISGQPIANLVASTSGTDSDWVVKVIDVYPDEVAGQPGLGGYQLMVSADIFRGRYRESLEIAKPIVSDKPLPYRFALPPRRTTSSCRATGSWCRFNRAGSPSTIEIRRLSSLIYFGQAGRLPKGRTANLPHTRSGKLYRTAVSFDTLKEGTEAFHARIAGRGTLRIPRRRSQCVHQAVDGTHSFQQDH